MYTGRIRSKTSPVGSTKSQIEHTSVEEGSDQSFDFGQDEVRYYVFRTPIEDSPSVTSFDYKMDQDFLLALSLQRDFDNEASEVINKSSSGQTAIHSQKKQESNSLVDPQWEFIDPTPDIHVLFLQFNDRFFWGKLLGVEVKWSPRMTSCAGVCVYQGRAGFCSVRLSLPLLKLRPRKDLVETLLHEMIHAYLFVTKNNRDRDGHGPEFHKHMNRINQEAGTRISVYHSFHDEVRLYQQHWWRCNGPCQKRPPFFGMVRRSMNRAPGPYDNWFPHHQATCGGEFIKVKEPENSNKKKSSDQNSAKHKDIRSFFPGNASSSKQGSTFTNSSTGIKATTGSLNSFGQPSGSKAFTPKELPGRKAQYSTGQGLQEPTKKAVLNNVRSLSDITGNSPSPSVRPISNPAVNKVVGFGNQDSKSGIGGRQTNGKGYVLGGSTSGMGKPFQRGGNSFGGSLLNKGSGTLVLPGSTSKAKDPKSLPDATSPVKKTVPQSSVVPAFSGTGYILGSGTSSKGSNSERSSGTDIPGSLVKKVNPSKTNSSILTNGKLESMSITDPTKRTSPGSLVDSKRQKTLSNTPAFHDLEQNDPFIACPVCKKQVLEDTINCHLDVCILSSSKTEKDSEVILLSDSDDDSKSLSSSASVNCPSCDKRILEREMNDHLTKCIGTSFEDDGDDIILLEPNSSKKANCPICAKDILVGDMDKHLDNCASCSIQDLSGAFDEDYSDEEEDAAVGTPSQRVSKSGEKLFPCPCCLVLIESNQMNEHLDQCML